MKKNTVLIILAIIILQITITNQIKIFKSSFIETDEVDEDDVDAGDVKKAEIAKEHNNEIINLLETRSEKNESENLLDSSNLIEKDKEDKKKKKTLADYLYSKPKQIPTSDNQRISIYRNGIMSELQKSHTWKVAARENVSDQQYSKTSASFGKTNSDEFVSFLGYLRDASNKASKLIAQHDSIKIEKTLKNIDYKQ